VNPGRSVRLDTGPFRRLRDAMRRARQARIVETDATLVPVRGAEGVLRPAPRWNHPPHPKENE